MSRGTIIWTGLSLKTRLMLLFALLLVIGLAINVGRLFNEAGPRVAAEDESSVRLASDFIRSAVPALDAALDPNLALTGLVKSLRNLRHIEISLRSDLASGKLPVDDNPEAGAVPAWFVRLVRPETLSTTVEVAVNGHPIDAIVIESNPIDEIGEIWDGILSQVVIDSVIAAALLVITYLTVDRALAPIRDLSRAMAQIGDGQYQTRIRASGPPELAAICRQLNALAVVLGAAVSDRQRLVERIVTLQDDERRDLARELHDEFGPYLFAIRAQVAVLTRGPLDSSGQREDAARAIGEQVDALQASNRRVLEKLRPVALDDLGLESALTALIDGLREARPQIDADFRSELDLENLGKTTSLTVYRVVQEGLTNAFRHADATQIAVTIDEAAMEGWLRIRVNDNGIGLSDDFRDGLGLKGMKERLAALGGSLKIGSPDTGGAEVEALIPFGQKKSVGAVTS